jgi:predicted GIY-YIG superfamily endonuclease
VWFVYILRCADNSLYVGETNDVGLRLANHNRGQTSAFTSARRPLALSYVESHATRDVALKRGKRIKRWTRAKKEALIAGDLDLLRRL